MLLLYAHIARLLLSNVTIVRALQQVHEISTQISGIFILLKIESLIACSPQKYPKLLHRQNVLVKFIEINFRWNARRPRNNVNITNDTTYQRAIHRPRVRCWRNKFHRRPGDNSRMTWRYADVRRDQHDYK